MVQFTNPETEETSFVELAYVKGYNATEGALLSNIILAFGRQLENGRETRYGEVLEGWHVLLPPDDEFGIEERDRVKNHDWVVSVVEAFMQGYGDNPDHGSTVIAIGTNNANFAWDCDSILWAQAGRRWGELMERIQIPGQKISLASANDIESWFGEFPLLDEDGDIVRDEDGNIVYWTACGSGAQAWYRGYEGVFPDRPLPNVNFGSDVLRELPEEWSPEQSFDVFAGFRSARAHPQIYCPQWVTPLVNFADMYRNDIFFYGVTSENNGNRNTCGTDAGSLTWKQSWLQFRDGLSSIELQNKLAPSVSSFCILPRDSDKRCARYGTALIQHTTR